MTKAYELLAHLKHLTLAGQDEYGDLEWIGTKEDWRAVEMDIEKHENE